MHRLVIAVLVLAVAVTAVVADFDPATGSAALRVKAARYMARGDTGLASADDGATIGYNPANLAGVNITNYSETPEGWVDPKPVKTECANSLEASGDLNFWSLLRAIRDVRKDWGIGLGYVSVSPLERTEWWTVGFGSRISHSPWNAGVAFQHVGGGLLGEKAENLINLGVQGNYPLKNGVKLQFGGLVRDITGRTDEGPFYNAGVAATYKDTLFEVDVNDLTDQIDCQVNLGVQQKLGKSWSLYAGLVDGKDLTAGAGFIDGWWNLAAGWMNSPDSTDLGSEFVLTVGRRIRF